MALRLLRSSAREKKASLALQRKGKESKEDEGGGEKEEGKRNQPLACSVTQLFSFLSQWRCVSWIPVLALA